jgi:hypothetical protein
MAHPTFTITCTIKTADRFSVDTVLNAKSNGKEQIEIKCPCAKLNHMTAVPGRAMYERLLEEQRFGNQRHNFNVITCN